MSFSKIQIIDLNVFIDRTQLRKSHVASTVTSEIAEHAELDILDRLALTDEPVVAKLKDLLLDTSEDPEGSLHVLS